MSPGVRRVINGDPLTLCAEFACAEPLRDAWEPAMYARFKAALRPGMTVLDVGASFGLYTLAAARVVGPAGRVFAFEPARRSAAALRLHLDWNGASGVVDIVEEAAAERTGTAPFWEQETSFLASLIEATARQERRYASAPHERLVRVVALDEFCDARGLEPDVVKIDVEGGEADVLRGARRLLRRHRGALFLELHSGFPGAEGPTAAVFAELKAAGWNWARLGAAGQSCHYACSPADGG